MVTKKKTKFFKSLRFRILVILLILGIVPSAIVTQLMISNYEKQAIEVKVSEVSTQCAILCNQIIKENYLNDSSSQSVNSKLELLSNVYGGRMVLVDRDLKVVADTYHVDEGRNLISPKVVKCFKNGEVTNYRRYGQMLEMAVPVKSADVPQIQGAMLVNISISDIMATVGAQEQMAMLLTGIIVALSVLLAYGLSTILVKPLASVTKSIEDLTDGYQKDEISVPDYTETELITDAFNKMLARMKVLDESRSEFVSNVSHELKTPMTSMKVLADSLVGQEGVPEELYQEFMRDITAEIDRENRIITDLLTLVKMDKKSADLQISHMDINQLLEDILKRLRPIADKRNIDLILDSFRPVEADVDELRRHCPEHEGQNRNEIFQTHGPVAPQERCAQKHDVAGLRVGEDLTAADIGIGVLKATGERNKDRCAEGIGHLPVKMMTALHTAPRLRDTHAENRRKRHILYVISEKK